MGGWIDRDMSASGLGDLSAPWVQRHDALGRKQERHVADAAEIAS